MKLDGKIVIVTGAAAGIGKEIINGLRSKNCKIIAADITYDSNTLGEPNLAYFKCDLSDLAQIDGLFSYTKEQYGIPDIFIANAGFAYFGKTQSLTKEQIQKIFILNSVSIIATTSAMQKLHGDQPFRMVIMASAMAHWSVPGYATYSATKAALVGFAKAYRYELHPNQRLQIVYPIGTRTHFFEKAGNSPVPIISQTPKQVANATIRGIEGNTDDIYPSITFWVFLHLNRLFPFIKPIVLWVENKNLKAWLDK
jgi:short-subunit dehydrogenase